MDLIVLDDIFTDKFLLELNLDVKDIPWKYKNIANRSKYPYDCPTSTGSHLFFGNRIYDYGNGIDVHNETPKKLFEAFYVIMDHLKLNNTFLMAIDCNLQVYGQDGTTHIDQYYTDMHSRDYTIMLYPNYKWDAEWGGPLEIIDGKGAVIESHLPLPGRVICFDSTIKHRAIAPSVPNVGRYSIAFRMKRDLVQL
jgi:hypothetical protein